MSSFFCALDRGLNKFYVVCGVIAACFLVLLAVLILLSIFSRWLGIYVPGLNAYSGYAMAASSYFALAYTFREGGHIRVVMLRNAMSGRPRFALEVWCLSIASFFACYMAWFLVRMTWFSYDFEEKSEGADATLLWIPQSLMAFGATVMALTVVHALVKTLVTGTPDLTESAQVE
ncbi:MAG: TRAP transporter small permease [Alphaproteobacteria bacterium]|nr:TRAP transporter small permease [Alphaproteobacteria bacterium]